jgi:UDP-N-acetylmuramoyl-L-alanyl-D-glutamate--2,6-diaminopimelate ligase
MERVAGPQEITVLVDYAHTEDAVRAAMETLRPLTRAKLWVVLGAGGDRDKGKRPKMAAAAESLADELILTSDNPRNEDPKVILQEMKSGLSAGSRVLVIENRSEAIRTAVLGAGSGDVVLIAGKGHEEFQEMRGTKLPFSDRREAERAWAERGGR